MRENPTESELLFYNRLKENGINFIFQKCFIANDYYCIVDFYLPKPYKLVIEIDGEYHNEKSQILKDKFRDKYLTEKRKMNVIRIKNSDVNKYNISSFI